MRLVHIENMLEQIGNLGVLVAIYSVGRSGWVLYKHEHPVFESDFAFFFSSVETSQKIFFLYTYQDAHFEHLFECLLFVQLRPSFARQDGRACGGRSTSQLERI